MRSNLSYHLQVAEDMKSTKNYLWIIHLFLNYLTIILSISISIVYDTTYIYFISIFLIGSRMRALMNLLHEASHHNLIPKSEFYNKIIANLFCAFPLFTTFDTYLESHTRHHINFQDINKDPDMRRYAEVFGDNFVTTKQDINFFQIFNIFSFIKYSYYFPLKNFFSSKLKEYKAMFLFWTTVLYLAYTFDSIQYLILYWFIPYLTTYKVIAYIAELFEHAGLYANTNLLTTTRNIYTNNIIAYLFWPHGDNYHLLHHLLATVPGYNLKQISKYLINKCPEYKKNHAFYNIQFNTKEINYEN